MSSNGKVLIAVVPYEAGRKKILAISDNESGPRTIRALLLATDPEILAVVSHGPHRSEVSVEPVASIAEITLREYTLSMCSWLGMIATLLSS